MQRMRPGRDWPCVRAAMLALVTVVQAQNPAGGGGNDPAAADARRDAQAQEVASRFEGKPVADLSYAGPQPMFMPSDVAVSGDRRIYVADGVNNRVIWFDAAGNFGGQIRAEQSGGLLRPVAVHIDAEGRLWIADTGHGRVIVYAPADASEQVIEPKVDKSGTSLDLTGVSLTATGPTAWLVDNNGSRLFRMDITSGKAEPVGQPGEALGQFYYPFMLELGSDGRLFVTDVINGRVQVLDQAGKPVRSIGSYGIEVGELYRPSGITLDAEGRVWVSDGVLGVVQVFSAAGDFLGVLGRGGKPLKFDVPMGLAFDKEGDLYVVEMGASRVRRVDITVPPGPVRALPRTARPAGPPQPRQPRTCTACHLEWVYPLSQGRRTLYIPTFENPPQFPHVSRAETCLSCHNGVTADSRQAIWYEKSHPIAVEPPKDMPVPARLPLADGQMVCRTCHVAHRRAGPATIATAVYIRMRDDPSELCSGCHAGFEAGRERGMHPLGPMSIPVPVALREHSSEAVQNRATCLSCHRPHGAREDLLHALPGETNELCLSCHQELSPGLFTEDKRSKHGQRPELTDVQQAVAASFGTRTGDGQTLICLTCHQAHRATSKQYLLAFNPAGVGSCAGCHPDQRSVIKSSHDLRTNHPHAPNELGLTPVQAGPCSGCHGAHRYARAPAPTVLDPQGQCITCHRSGHVAADAQLSSVNHPAVACQTCHNPHEPRHGEFLVAPPSTICRQCHEPMFALGGGPHDLKKAPQAWPAQAAKTSDPCLACHRLHGTDETGLFRMGLAAEGPRGNAACLACHEGASPQAGSEQSLLHPVQVTTLPAETSLPVALDAGRQSIACHTCHDPHRDAKGGGPAGALLQLTEQAGQALCLNCHREMAGVNSIGHAVPFLRAAGFQAVACQPCHTVHNDPAAVDPHYLYPKSLIAQAKEAEGSTIADRYCVSCHREGGPVPPPKTATHPAVPMFNIDRPGQPGFLPLFDEQGQVAPNGSMSCRTCHITHGRLEPAILGETLGNLSPRAIQARQWHLRTFEPGNLCTHCHGEEAMYRFLYFHEPQFRSVSIGGGLVVPEAPARP